MLSRQRLRRKTYKRHFSKKGGYQYHTRKLRRNKTPRRH
jgi:hypothetical protein